MNDRQSKALGCMLGMALGDAYGAPTEFLSIDAICSRWPPSGPTRPLGYPGPEDSSIIHVTDDTQMAIAVGKVLCALSQQEELKPSECEELLRESYHEWYHSPDNTRAPGNTCLRSCQKLEEGLPWWEATSAWSKGCGANMRVPPVGLWKLDDPDATQQRSALAQFQAALTHGHPTGLAAADLTAFSITRLLKGSHPKDLLQELFAYIEQQKTRYHERWLGPLWQQPTVTSKVSFISRGWEECLQALKRVEESLVSWDGNTDPCLMTGEGWIAEEALATGLFCFLVHPEKPVGVIKRASVTSGDSDSIASLAGAFAGAYHGHHVWPDEWVQHIEYKEQLEAIALQLIAPSDTH